MLEHRFISTVNEQAYGMATVKAFALPGSWFRSLHVKRSLRKVQELRAKFFQRDASGCVLRLVQK